VGPDANTAVRLTIAVAAALVVLGAVTVSKRKQVATDADVTGEAPAKAGANR
jgi:hypothetical protein